MSIFDNVVFDEFTLLEGVKEKIKEKAQIKQIKKLNDLIDKRYKYIEMRRTQKTKAPKEEKYMYDEDIKNAKDDINRFRKEIKDIQKSINSK